MDKSDQELANQVGREHEALRDTMERLGTLFDRKIDPDGFVGWKLDLLRQLRDFENQLQKHFDLEEHGGYNAELIRIAPQLASRIAHLEEDHRKIVSDLDHVLDIVKSIENESSPMLPRVKDRIDTLLTLTRQHESQENAVVQDAYYQEYGAGD